MTERPPVYHRVPAGTPAKPCRGCDVQVYWITTARGRGMPVDVSVDGGRAPTAETPGIGISHFATCPHAGWFRKLRRPGAA